MTRQNGCLDGWLNIFQNRRHWVCRYLLSYIYGTQNGLCSSQKADAEAVRKKNPVVISRYGFFHPLTIPLEAAGLWIDVSFMTVLRLMLPVIWKRSVTAGWQASSVFFLLLGLVWYWTYNILRPARHTWPKGWGEEWRRTRATFREKFLLQIYDTVCEHQISIAVSV